MWRKTGDGQEFLYDVLKVQEPCGTAGWQRWNACIPGSGRRRFHKAKPDTEMERKRNRSVAWRYTAKPQAGRLQTMILDSSMVEHTAVNRGVVGSSPTRGVKWTLVHFIISRYGSIGRAADL